MALTNWEGLNISNTCGMPSSVYLHAVNHHGLFDSMNLFLWYRSLRSLFELACAFFLCIFHVCVCSVYCVGVVKYGRLDVRTCTRVAGLFYCGLIYLRTATCPGQECVPVILSDQVELPFQNVIDYTQISIKWPSTLTSTELLVYLQSIPGKSSSRNIAFLCNINFLATSDIQSCYSDEEIERMIARGKQVRCLWVYASDDEPCSAMLGIKWELQRKVRRFHQSAETFWLHNRSIINRNLVDFHGWKPPMPLP